MGEVFITRKGGGGKAAAPTIAVTNVGGTWIEVSVTNNDATPSAAQLFVLANYDPNSETDFDLQASQNGYVFAVAAGAIVTQLITGLDPDTSHTVSASAAVIKKLPSNVVTTDSTDLDGTGVTAPSLGPLVENNPTTSVITVTNNDTNIPLVIKANVTTSTTAPTTYPFETASLAVGVNTSLTITGVTPETTFYIHARAFDGTFSSSNVVFGPYTTPEEPLYDFTTWTFTNAGVTGRTGPNISQVRSAYSSQSWAQNNDYLAMTTNGIQNWTVPVTGTYQIEAFGAGGGGNQTNNGGRGARMRGDFSLTKGEVVRILVGQNGQVQAIGGWSGAGPNSSGGNGGSFVVRSPYNTNSSIAVIAGGGTGNGEYLTAGGRTQTSGGNNGQGDLGGVNGNGGSAGCRTSGGGGFFTNGVLVTAVSIPNSFGTAFVNGGLGGESNTNCGWPTSRGGFGGGSGLGGGCNPNGGAGGGYSGGAGGCNNISGAGGSYNNGNNQSNSADVRSGHGQVTITRL